METYTEKTVIQKKSPAPGVVRAEGPIYKEERAAGEIGDRSTFREEEQAGGLFESLKEGVMAGVETVREGVNYLADRVTGAAEDVNAPAAKKTETTTIVQPGPHPEVEQRTRIVEAQTRYPNQQGFGVNPKFKEDSDNGALADIKSGIKKGVENIKEGAKEFKDDVKAGAQEIKNKAKETFEDVKIEGNRLANNPPDAYPRSHAEQARRLENRAEDLLDERDKDLQDARKAQAKADQKAWEANVKTSKAMNKQELGQQYLAGAGAEMERAAVCNRGVREETCTKTVNRAGGQKVETKTERHVY